MAITFKHRWLPHVGVQRSLLHKGEKECNRHWVEHLREGKPQPVTLTHDNVIGGFGSVLVAVIAVLPSFAPFLLFYKNPALAIRLSNVVSFVMLFIYGYQWGQHTGASPWKTGLLLAAVGAVMVLIAIPLGG